MDNLELFDMFISVITISLAFSVAFFYRSAFDKFFIVLVTVGMGFLLHEMAHKFVAISYGCEARYVAWMPGLVIAVLFAIVTQGRFIFAAPGWTAIYKQYLTSKEDGVISLAGPMINIILALFFLWLAMFSKNFLLIDIGTFGFFVNSFLALFNLIPIPPLDGSKVISWNPVIWATTFIIAIYLALALPASITLNLM